MASIERRNDGWRVRWRDPDETPRSRQCPTQATAKTLAREVEDASALGRRWEPRDAREQADLRVLFKDYIEECVRVLKPATAGRYALALDLFLRFCDDTFGKGKPLPPSILTRRLLADDRADVGRDGRLHRGARRLAPRSGRRLAVHRPARAEAMSLTWDDLDLSNARLRIRIVPVSPQLLRRLTATPHEDRFVVPCNRQPGPRQRASARHRARLEARRGPP